MLPITTPLYETFARCKVLQSKFFVNQRIPEVGEYVELPLTTAESLVQSGKAEIVEILDNRVNLTPAQLACPPRRSW